MSHTKKQNNRTWIEIDRAALYHNIDQITSLLGATQLGVVVKANAYGHDMLLVASLLEAHPRVQWLFTAGIHEARTLRLAGCKKPILVLSYYDAPFEDAIHHTIDLAVYDAHTICAVAQAARAVGKRARVHLKIDTGMHRLGVLPHDARALAKAIMALPELELYGIFSHFSDLNSPDLSHSYKQCAVFNTVIDELRMEGITVPCTHILSSGALVLPTERAYTLARIGTTVYGFWKSPLQQERFLAKKNDFSLRQVMTWKSTISHIKTVPADSYIGYNRSFYTPTPLTIALIPIGYYDGYPRSLSNKSSVRINGQYARLVGIVSMNIITVDVTGIAATVGDEVIICGDYDGIRATDLAALGDTINNEYATRIPAEIPRIVV